MEISSKPIKDPVYTHQIINSDTKEPIVKYKKSPYGNHYDYQLHPEFLSAHKDVIHQHEINDAANSFGIKKNKVEQLAQQIHNSVYNRHYNKDEFGSKYKYSHSTKDDAGEDLHHYHLHDSNNDHVISFAVKSKNPVSKSQIKSWGRTSLGKSKYSDDQVAAAKVLVSPNTVSNIVHFHDKLHEISKKPEPRFVGHQLSDKPNHISFKTKLEPKAAIDAYSQHLIDKHPEIKLKNKTDSSAILGNDDKTHMIQYHDGILHHTLLDHRYDHQTKPLARVIESTNS